MYLDIEQIHVNIYIVALAHSRQPVIDLYLRQCIRCLYFLSESLLFRCSVTQCMAAQQVMQKQTKMIAIYERKSAIPHNIR